MPVEVVRVKRLGFWVFCAFLTSVAGCASTNGPGAGPSDTGPSAHPSQQQALSSIERKQAAVARKRPVLKRPEIAIPGTTKKVVLDALVGQMTRRDYTIRRIDEYRAQFEHPGGFWLDVLAGSRFNRDAPWRISYTIFDAVEGVHVVADVGVVTNPGSALEHVTDVRNLRNSAAIQTILDAIKVEVSRTHSAAPTTTDSTSRSD